MSTFNKNEALKTVKRTMPCPVTGRTRAIMSWDAFRRTCRATREQLGSEHGKVGLDHVCMSCEFATKIDMDVKIVHPTITFSEIDLAAYQNKRFVPSLRATHAYSPRNCSDDEEECDYTWNPMHQEQTPSFEEWADL